MVGKALVGREEKRNNNTETKMHVTLSALLLLALGGHCDARLSGNRQLWGGLEGLQTNPPTSASEIGQNTDDPDPDALLGEGGHGQQITDPSQFDQDGNALYGNLDGIAYEQGDDTLLGGDGHGQQITDPSQFDQDGNAMYGSNPSGGPDEDASGANDPDDTPLLGGDGHGQQITDPSQFDQDGNAIYGSNPMVGGDDLAGDVSGANDPDDSPLLGGGGHGQQITDPNKFDEDGNVIYNDSDGFGGDSNFDGMSNMTMENDMDMGNMTMDMDKMDNMTMDMDMDNMDMMNGLNDTDFENQNNTGIDGGLDDNNYTDYPYGDIDGDTNLDGADESINGDQGGDGNFPWDRDETSAPSPAYGDGTGGGGLPSFYSPSPAPIGENNGYPTYPTYGQNTYVPTIAPSKEFGTTPTDAPSSFQNFPTWDYPQPSSKPVAYIPPEEKDNDFVGGTDDMQGGTSIEGTGGIGDYLYFDHAEPIEEMEHDRNVAIALGICGGIGLCLAIITAQQMLENPHGCCAGMCRILVSVTCGFTRCICFPFRWICGCGTTSKQERYSNELISGGGYNEEYISDLELT